MMTDFLHKNQNQIIDQSSLERQTAAISSLMRQSYPDGQYLKEVNKQTIIASDQQQFAPTTNGHQQITDLSCENRILSMASHDNNQGMQKPFKYKQNYQFRDPYPLKMSKKYGQKGELKIVTKESQALTSRQHKCEQSKLICKKSRKTIIKHLWAKRQSQNLRKRQLTLAKPTENPEVIESDQKEILLRMFEKQSNNKRRVVLINSSGIINEIYQSEHSDNNNDTTHRISLTSPSQEQSQQSSIRQDFNSQDVNQESIQPFSYQDEISSTQQSNIESLHFESSQDHSNDEE